MHSLGTSRFLKSIKCRHQPQPQSQSQPYDGTPLVAKAFLKPLALVPASAATSAPLVASPTTPPQLHPQHPQSPLSVVAQSAVFSSADTPLDSQQNQNLPMSLKQTVRAIQDEAALLIHIPNAFPYIKVIETQRAAYMVRQFLYSNLYDRISTRPFLSFGEKIWITFQILTGLSQAHALNIYHGDIKTENILVTSWTWAYISDFSASHKPVHLPEDNPADFNFFFDSSSRRSCYLAPERFLAPGETLFHVKRAELTPEMDIFGIGCTIAEMFLEGTPIFNLSQLLRYRRGEYDPSLVLDKIENFHVREMLSSMIDIDPKKRKSIDAYLNEFRDLIFPSYYSTFLHTFIHGLSLNTSNIGGQNQQQTRPLSSASLSSSPSPGSVPLSQTALGAAASASAIPVTADVKIEKMFYEFWRVAEAAGIPNEYENSNRQSSKNRDDVCLILTTIVCTTLRNTHYATSRLMALELILVLGIQLTDEDRLDRIVPYVVYLLQDENAMVRCLAVKVLTQLLSMVESITTADVTIFQEYILPILKPLSADTEIIVRISYAGCIASIAETALRFLELAQLFQQNFSEAEGDGNIHQLSYDVALHELHESIQDQVVVFLSDPDVDVKRALLFDMARLCIFFGKQRANDVLLGHMITYLNDKDWQLRSAFFESIVGVGTFVGWRSLEEYILPLMVQSLTDAEEFVVEKVLMSLTLLAELGLFQKPKLKELANSILPLLCHPSPWIRHGAIAFIATTSKLLPLIDVRCILYRELKPFLKSNMSDISEINLLFNLKSPLSRVLFDQALLLATQAPAVSYKKEIFDDVLELSQSDSNENNTELIQRLREFGMTDEDKEKLFALKYYISKSTQRRGAGVGTMKFSGAVLGENDKINWRGGGGPRPRHSSESLFSRLENSPNQLILTKFAARMDSAASSDGGGGGKPHHLAPAPTLRARSVSTASEAATSHASGPAVAKYTETEASDQASVVSFDLDVKSGARGKMSGSQVGSIRKEVSRMQVGVDVARIEIVDGVGTLVSG
ncbi:Serine/threonine-protein kinase, partial [Physocladia obscura]